MELFKLILFLQCFMSNALQEVHCDPSSELFQICPSGDLCDPNVLDCKIDKYYDGNDNEFRHIQNCICPHHVRGDRQSEDYYPHRHSHDHQPHYPHRHIHHIHGDRQSEDHYPHRHSHDHQPQHTNHGARQYEEHYPHIYRHHDLHYREQSKVYCIISDEYLHICPTGEHCLSSLLNCLQYVNNRYENNSITYCECPDHQSYSYKEVHCDPNSDIIQICPLGEICFVVNLQCAVDEVGDDYCVCPAYPHNHHAAHCNPNSPIQQICPNGEICDSSVLHCEKDSHNRVDYCICPHDQYRYNYYEDEHQYQHNYHEDDHHQHQEQPTEVYCNSSDGYVQICPDGKLCLPKFVHCKLNENSSVEYCVCPDLIGHYEPHCDPSSVDVQICPHGELCDPYKLQCVGSEDNIGTYCICPTHHHEDHHEDHLIHEAHCNPNSPIRQFCPNGEICDSSVLRCEKDIYSGLDYCKCPHNDDHHHHQEQPTEVHCNPSDEFVQICPSGRSCLPKFLDCKLNANSMIEYCVCPEVRLDVHCDPNSNIQQICPFGQMCSRILDCVTMEEEEYCICPLSSDDNYYHF